MGIENMTLEKTPDNGKSSVEQKDTFTREEQKLIDEYSKSDKYETIDPSNMEAETKKTWGEAHRSEFFESNYKIISKNPDKYPKLYPLLQIFLANNKIAVENMFDENFREMNKSFTREEDELCNTIRNSYEMQSWLQQNPQKNRRNVRDKYVDFLFTRISERIDQKNRNNFINLPNFLTWMVKELFYAAEDDMQKNQITPDTKKRLTNTNEILSYISKNNPILYETFTDIHTSTKSYLATIKGQTMVEDMNINLVIGAGNDKLLEDFVKVAKNKDQDQSVLEDATRNIQPVIKSIYEKWLESFNKAKEEKDPLQQLMYYTEADEHFKKITSTKEDAGITFENEDLELICTLSTHMNDEIDEFMKSSSIIPLLYDAGYKTYQEALRETDETAKEEKYASAKTYFEKLLEHKDDKDKTKKMNDLMDEAQLKLDAINQHLTPVAWTNYTIENIDISDLPIHVAPNPFDRDKDDLFKIYMGENKQDFDTVEIISLTWQIVSTYKIGTDVQIVSDIESSFWSTTNNAKKIEIPLKELSLSKAMYFMRISSKRTQITKSEKFIVQ